jgi:magnesium-transporting ATPase (P-type)
MTGALAAGLTDTEVAQRVTDGNTNGVPNRAARSVADIVRANIFTRINAILGVLLLIVLATGSVINGLFGLLIIANSGVGIIQEIRAKRTLDKLAVVGQAKPTVRRALLIGAVWVLATVARPYQWWRVGLVALSGLAAALVIEVLWWIQARILGEQRRLWR